MNLDVKLLGENRKKINLSILFEEVVRSNKPNSPSEKKFLDDQGQLIEDSNLIFFGEFDIEEKENYSSLDECIHLEYRFRKGEKIPNEADFIVISKLASPQRSISKDVNKAFRHAFYAKIEKNVNGYNNSKTEI